MYLLREELGYKPGQSSFRVNAFNPALGFLYKDLHYCTGVCSLEGLMLKLKRQYFGHLIRRVDSLEKSLMLGGIGVRRRRGRQMAGWHRRLDVHEFE